MALHFKSTILDIQFELGFMGNLLRPTYLTFEILLYIIVYNHRDCK